MRTFEMALVEVFTIIGRGVVVVGPFEGELPSKGDPLVLMEEGLVVEQATCQGVGWSRLVEDDCRYGILLGGIDRDRDQVLAGQVLAAAP